MNLQPGVPGDFPHLHIEQTGGGVTDVTVELGQFKVYLKYDKERGKNAIHKKTL